MSGRRTKPEPPPQALTFETRSWDEHHEGVAAGVDGFELRRLEFGDYPPEIDLDLHGVGEEEARTLVRDGLRRASRAGLRCLRIVHGRGLRSPGGPVLKRALPRWLAAPPHGRRVMAFTTSGKYGSGGGATLVLLHPKRSADSDL